MKQPFADTSFFVALGNPADSLHELACTWIERLDSGLLTTEYVLVELGNFFRRPGQRTAFLEIEREIRLDHESIILPCDSERLQQGIELFSNRPDKAWSLTDCLSFIAMQHHGITDALTADRHFEQAGYTALLAQ